MMKHCRLPGRRLFECERQSIALADPSVGGSEGNVVLVTCVMLSLHVYYSWSVRIKEIVVKDLEPMIAVLFVEGHDVQKAFS